jgi:nitrogen fixation/metabolism regulation signal transduction histidine kinase
MKLEEAKETVRSIDKMMLDSVNLITAAKDRAEGSVLTRYLNELQDDRSALLKRFDKMEMELKSEIPNNEQVGGSIQATYLEDSALSDKAILKEVLNGDQDLLEKMEKEMVKPINEDVKSLFEEGARELIRNTETMKNMIEKDEV